MNFTVSRDSLLAALSAVSGVALRSTIPILSCVRIEARDSRLRLSCTNLDQWLEFSVSNVAVGEPGAVCIDIQRLKALVGTWPAAAQVSARTEGLSVIFTSGRSRLTFPGEPETDFPVVTFGEAASMGLSREGFAKMAALALPPIEYDISRPYLSGLHLSGKNGVITAIGASAPRMAVASFPAQDAEFDNQIMPKEAVQLIARLARGDGDDLRFSVHAGRVKFSAPNWTLTTKIIGVESADLRRALAPIVDRPAMVVTDELVAVARRAAVVLETQSAKSSGARIVRLLPEAGGITIRNKEGEFEDWIAAQVPPDTPPAILNAAHLADAGEALGADELELHFGGVEATGFRLCRADEKIECVTLATFRF